MSSNAIDVTGSTPPKRSRKKPASMTAASGSAAASTSAAASGEGATKKRKRQAEPKPAKEKRTFRNGSTAAYSRRPNIPTQERMERALGVGFGMNHRLYLINSGEKQVSETEGPSQVFTVLGATGNVYDVTIGRWPHCTCPDRAKGNLCKHILFVMLRVLGLPRDNPIVWQRALLTHEAEEALSHSNRINRNVMASRAVSKRWQAATGRSPTAASGSSSQPEAPKRRPVEGDCSICYEPMEEGGEALTWCASCGNNMHRACFSRWASAKRSSGATVTCTLCRAPWQDGDSPKPPETTGNHFERQYGRQYLNLAGPQQQGADYTDLYGDRAVWVEANQGNISRRAAARAWRASQY